ncbi:MAG: 4-alpha-glucanotransferase, partial [Deltaproteobacteria bacterium]
ADKEPIRKEIANLKKAFAQEAPYVDYRIKWEKVRILREIWSHEGSLASREAKDFCAANAYWLQDFALFMVLREYHRALPWYEWDEKFKNRQPDALESFRKEHDGEVNFQIWMQWQLYRQFRQVKKYAEGKNILIKGDLPILVSRDSADVWSHQEFFKLDFASGAPPDVYCAKGQRWGMPIYNWERIAQDGYRYLKEKLKYAGNFYDILRIDHVVGLFRIWSIPYCEPVENQGLHGSFDPVDEKAWGSHGEKILSVMLESTDMLLCAEDLGIIPKSCTETLAKFGIPGNDVQRWVKDWKIKHDFLSPREYRVLSVAMLSTHDTTNWSAWWENEAGTVDENLFVRKCRDRGINFIHVKDKLFDPARSKHYRLRWLDSVSSVEILVSILGKPKEQVMDFVDLYLNSYQEKEKLWKHLNLSGPMREKADKKILAAVLKITLGSSSIFCIENILDWLSLSGILKGDPYQYRFNTPGSTGPQNWSLRIPMPLEDLLKHKVCTDIRKLISSSGRIQ